MRNPRHLRTSSQFVRSMNLSKFHRRESIFFSCSNFVRLLFSQVYLSRLIVRARSGWESSRFHFLLILILATLATHGKEKLAAAQLIRVKRLKAGRRGTVRKRRETFIMSSSNTPNVSKEQTSVQTYKSLEATTPS